MGYIRTGLEQGATALIGGDQPPEGVDAGYFVSPTLFVDVDNSMTIAREEIFGPVLVVIPYEDDDDAVRIANDNDYGLAGYVLSESLERSIGVAASPPRREHRAATARPRTVPKFPSAATRRAASAGRTASPVSSSTSR